MCLVQVHEESTEIKDTLCHNCLITKLTSCPTVDLLIYTIVIDLQTVYLLKKTIEKINKNLRTAVIIKLISNTDLKKKN